MANESVSTQATEGNSDLYTRIDEQLGDLAEVAARVDFVGLTLERVELDEHERGTAAQILRSATKEIGAIIAKIETLAFATTK